MKSLQQTQQKLDAVSKSFCLAKWLQVSLHLPIGHNHSCAHPSTHRIPLNELKKSPAALHNTLHKKERRQQMILGQRPSECSFCWKIEDAQGDQFSDRVHKSQAEWAAPYFEEALSHGADKDILPRYLEVSFSHACNLKCSYCAPQFSSRWEKEIKEHGPYPLRFPYLEPKDSPLSSIDFPVEEEKNPYVKAFWVWWPKVYPQLRALRVTGGEPLLSPSTHRIIDHVLEFPNPQLNLAINTNLSVPKPVIDKFINHLKQVRAGEDVKQIQIFTSVDTWGKQAEYLRHGLDFSRFWQNLERVMKEIPSIHVIITCTVNNLSFCQLPTLLKETVELKRRALQDSSSLLIDFNHLREPQHQSLLALPAKYVKEKVQDGLAIIDQNLSDGEFYGGLKFSRAERAKLERLINYSQSHAYQDPTQAQSDFFRFFAEHDRRRETQFLETFPEMSWFWKACQESDEKLYRNPVTRIKRQVRLSASRRP